MTFRRDPRMTLLSPTLGGMPLSPFCSLFFSFSRMKSAKSQPGDRQTRAAREPASVPHPETTTTTNYHNQQPIDHRSIVSATLTYTKSNPIHTHSTYTSIYFPLLSPRVSEKIESLSEPNSSLSQTKRSRAFFSSIFFSSAGSPPCNLAHKTRTKYNQDVQLGPCWIEGCWEDRC